MSSAKQVTGAYKKGIAHYWRHLALRDKFLVGFGSLVLLMTLSIGVTLYELHRVEKANHDIIQIRQPALFTFLEFTQKIHLATSALNGYLLTGDAEQKLDYYRIEKELSHELQIIHASINEQSSTIDPAILREIDKLYSQYKHYADRLFALRDDRVKNHPGISLAAEKLNPLHLAHMGMLQMIIDDEVDAKPSQRRQQVMYLLNEIRHSWVQMISSIRTFFTTRATRDLENVELYWHVYAQKLAALQEMDIQVGQNVSIDALAELDEISTSYRANMKEVIELFRDERWRADIYLMKTEVRPLVRQLRERLRRVAENQLKESGRDSQKLTESFLQIRISTLLLFVIALVIGVAVSIGMTRWLVPPIRRLMRAANFVANGELDIQVEVINQDEVGNLTQSFNKMVKTLKQGAEEKQRYMNEIEQLNENLEAEVSDRTRQIKEVLSELEIRNKELESSNQALERAALHDSLTGLPNRTLFNDRLRQAIKYAQRYNTSFVLIMVDVDKFKDINDNNGHMVGDKVLQAFSGFLARLLRGNDTVARLGGDEFAIILPGVNGDSVLPFLTRMNDMILEPILIDGLYMNIGCSIGLAVFPEHGKQEEDLIHAADMAMYQSKQEGLSYKIYDPQEDELISDIDRMVIDLKYAIENDKLTLNYQPIIDLTCNQVVSVEALSRWTHPEKGVIPTDQFIAIAEQKGLIQSLTRWMMNEAFLQCSDWRRKGVPINMSINLSVRNFLDPQLPDKILEAMQRTHVRPEWINLEITESMMMTNPAKALDIVNKFAQMGLSLSIDDFGVGYSSLSYLKRIPVNDLKIDRSFIMEMDKDAEDRIIVQSTIELAHNLGRKVVAEGVENETILSLLRQLGCDKVQGYHICRPQAAEAISDWFKSAEWAIPTSRTA